MMTEATNASRILPCTRCGYDLRGRLVGEQCPECGWTIDSAGPAWWDAITLERMSSMSMLAMVSCLLLLIVPSLFVLAVIGGGMSDLFGVTLIAFLMLMPFQAIAQFSAMMAIATRPLGRTRPKVLKAAAIARLTAFVLATVVIIVMNSWSNVAAAEYVGLASYFALPLVAVASDIVTLWVLAELRRECGWMLPDRGRVVPIVARALMWAVYPLLIVPIVGWFFAPIIWTVALAICFAELRRVAEAIRASPLFRA